MAAGNAARMRALLRRMQTVITVRRLVYRMFSPALAAPLDLRLWLYAASLVAKMRRLEGREAA